MPVSQIQNLELELNALGPGKVVAALSSDLRALCARGVEGRLAEFLQACQGKSWGAVKAGEWEVFRKWHLSTREDENLAAIFRSFGRAIEESVELYFMDLASASETYSGGNFDDETHDSFYLAAREVNSLGLRVQLEFLKDNAPSVYSKFLDRAGLRFVLPKRT